MNNNFSVDIPAPVGNTIGELALGRFPSTNDATLNDPDNVPRGSIINVKYRIQFGDQIFEGKSRVMCDSPVQVMCVVASSVRRSVESLYPGLSPQIINAWSMVRIYQKRSDPKDLWNAEIATQ